MNKMLVNLNPVKKGSLLKSMKETNDSTVNYCDTLPPRENIGLSVGNTNIYAYHQNFDQIIEKRKGDALSFVYMQLMRYVIFFNVAITW